MNQYKTSEIIHVFNLLKTKDDYQMDEGWYLMRDWSQDKLNYAKKMFKILELTDPVGRSIH